MSDFTNPEYASYVALCRELRLARELQEGDWLWRGGSASFPLEAVGVWHPGIARESVHEQAWLPSLSDWLEMLEQAGYSIVELLPLNAALGGWMASVDDVPVLDEVSGEGRTREEACARLWMAIHATVATQ